jgi:hypothetical protein
MFRVGRNIFLVSSFETEREYFGKLLLVVGILTTVFVAPLPDTIYRNL